MNKKMLALYTTALISGGVYVLTPDGQPKPFDATKNIRVIEGKKIAFTKAEFEALNLVDTNSVTSVGQNVQEGRLETLYFKSHTDMQRFVKSNHEILKNHQSK